MKINIGTDFSGAGAFEYALQKIGIDYNVVFACDQDKYVRKVYAHNHGEPADFPWDVYERAIPEEPLDFYCSSPPCQAFSMAGQRGGESDKRGILFYNSYEFIMKNKPRFFMFENVRGLMSDDNGKTFQKWLMYLGGKSVNGNPVLFPGHDSAPYHVYYSVLNAKNYGVAQNRERVFIIGIRDDADNLFSFPKPYPLKKKLKDYLEEEVEEKYFLSVKKIAYFERHKELHDEKGTGFSYEPKTGEDVANCIRANSRLCPTDNTLKIKSATKKGFEEAHEGDSLNLKFMESETRRGRVGKGVSQTIETGTQQAVVIGYTRNEKGKVIKRNINNVANTIHTQTGGGGNTDQFVGQLRQVVKYDTSPTLTEPHHNNQGLFDGYKIRRLTPRECFRLMDFPENFDFSMVSDSQAYKIAGNSVVVNCYAEILKKIVHLKK